MRVALSMAGSDSGGGAGIQADLKTFTVLGVYGAAVVTAVTAQNTRAILRILEVPAEVIAAQLDAVLGDLNVQAAKTGMLSSAAVVTIVAAKIAEYGLSSLVVDPVVLSKTGDALLGDDAIAELRNRLLPLSLVVTPNIPETELLVGRSLNSPEDLKRAARQINGMGAKHVVIKGGHGEGDEAIDLLFDGKNYVSFRSPRVDTLHTHGTGCTFSAAITAYLAEGRPVAEAVGLAKEFVFNAISKSIPLGHGRGPVNHLWRFTHHIPPALAQNDLE